MGTITDRIIFLHEPCPAATSTIVMTRESRLLSAFPVGHKIIADACFRGEEAIVVPFRRADATTDERKQHNRRLSQVRWKVEAAFARLKHFRVLSTVFRHNHSMHRVMFLTLIALYNIDVVRHPLVRRN